MEHALGRIIKFSWNRAFSLSTQVPSEKVKACVNRSKQARVAFGLIMEDLLGRSKSDFREMFAGVHKNLQSRAEARVRDVPI